MQHATWIIAAAVVAASATSATAASMITSAGIKDGTIKGRDISANTVTAANLSPALRALLASKGAAGAAGQDGDDGLDGAPGAKGDTGTAGGQGPKGDSGIPGAKGDTGTAGTDGTDGTRGPQGDPGTNGTNGTNGSQGDKGTDADASVVDAVSPKGIVLAPLGDNGDLTPNGSLVYGTPPVPSGLGAKALDMQTVNGRPVVLYVLPPLVAPATYPKLSTVSVASYSTLVHTHSDDLNADITWQFEVTGSTAPAFANGYTTVVEASTPPALDTWVHRSVDRSLVYSTKPLPSGDCTMAVPCTFSTFVNENPDAVIATAKLRLGKNNGAGWVGYDAWVDDITLQYGPAGHFDLGG